MKAAKLTIYGQVQGVFYRHIAQVTARQLGLVGTIKNKSNGTVVTAVEGEDAAVDQYIAWAHIGSPQAQVEQVEQIEVEPQGYQDFQIL